MALYDMNGCNLMGKSPLQLYVDKQNYLSVRRVLYQKQGDRMHQKVDGEVVFCMRC